MNYFTKWVFDNPQKCSHALFAFIFSILSVGVNAQMVIGTITDTTQYISGFDPKLIPPICTNPSVPNISVVQYATKAVAKLNVLTNGARIDNLTLNAKGDLKTNSKLSIDPEGGSTEAGSIVLNNLQLNQLYQVKGVNSCGESVVIAEFNTFPHRSGVDEIRVSDAMFRHISLYTSKKEGAMPLNKYVEGLPDVDVYEKISFLQKFFLKGSPLPDASIGTLPTRYVQQVLDRDPKIGGGGDPEPDPCVCEFVVNQGSYAVPDLNGSNQFIDRVTENDDQKFEASRWWWTSRAAGPAKFQQLSSDGWKQRDGKRGNIMERGISSQATNISPNYAKLSYTFLCVNFPAATPKECGCDKKVSIKAEYVSKVNVRATTRSGGGGEKKSWARAQDFAGLLVVKNNLSTVNDAVRVVQTNSIAFTAECKGGVATSTLIGSAAQLVGSVTSVIAAVNTGQIQDIGSSAQALTSDIADVFKLFEPNPEDCTPGVDAESALVQHTETITIKPNEPLTVVLFSGSRLESYGIRSWDSHARINSDFVLTGVLLGSNSADGGDYCCTDYSAQWAYATENRPITALQIPTNNFIFSAMNGAGTLTINNLPATGNNYCSGTEIGHATADFRGCTKKVPVYTFQQ